MSEEFDREAERERLRRQLEEEEEDRKATQQMSELLLKGATMTNKHCDQCGDPIFRYQGQEFCPTCQQTVASQDSGGQQAEAEESVEQPQPSAEPEPTPQPDPQPQIDRETVEPQPDPSADESRPQPEPQPQPAATGDLGEARASLVRKLSTLARQAEATDDVGRSRKLLAAAREAAEAISALEKARR